MMHAPVEGSGPVLRCILSPLRLLSGAAWYLIQQEAVSHYGMLEEFVSLITGILPDLLSYREMTQLTVGLRARLVLELCGMESPADPDTVQANLQRIESLVALHKDMELGDGLVKESGANFLALVQILITDPAERSIFFKDVYPLQYGVKFNTALQKLMWLFLSRLENALPQPTLEEAAHMLSTAPSVMEECVQSLSQPQQIRNALKYHRRAKVEMKETSQLWSTSPDDCILSCLSSPRSVQILLGEQTALDTQSGLGLDYVPSYCQEVQVESVAITQYIQNEPETTISDEIGYIIPYDAQESNECDPADTENSTAIDCEKVDSLDTDLDESPGEQDPAKVGVIDVKDGNGGEESLTPQEPKAMVTNQKEATELVNLYMMKQPLVKLHRLDVSSARYCKTFNSGPQKRGWPKKHLLNKTSCRNKQKQRNIAVPCASITKPPGFQNAASRIVPQLKKKHATVEGASGEYACSLCSFQDCEEIQLHQHLIVHHPEEYKPLCVTEEMQKPQDVVRAPCESEHQNSPVCKVRSYRGVPVCKTCPTCGKTFTRSSDMRRHQVSHTVDRPFLCPNCGKTFRYAFDLRRHQQRVCAHKDYVVVYKGKNVSEDRCVEIKVNDSGTVCQHLHTSGKSSESPGSGIQPSSSLCVEELPESGAAHATNTDSLLSCSQSEKKREDACMLINHKKMCASSERCFKCVKCDALFNTVLDVQNHMHVHWGDDLLQCSSCGKYCPSPSELAKHTLLHEKESKHPCTLCSDSLEGLDSLREHYLNVHEFKGPYQCSKCDKTHPDLKVIAKHMKTHGEVRPYQCSHCGKSFKQRSGLTVHAKIHSGDKPFLCEECGKCFSSNIGLQRHSVSHQSERPYTCPQCKHCFKTRYALHSHLLKHTTGASIPCEICGKLFYQASALHRHHRTHTGERPYSCPKCAKTFLTKEEVAKHMRYHTGERPFRCTLCSKTFTQTCYLSVHMRIHTGERPYQCSVCERAFVSSTHLKRHTLVHTRERPFKCDCGKAFNQAHTLKVHQRSQCLVQKKQL